MSRTALTSIFVGIAVIIIAGALAYNALSNDVSFTDTATTTETAQTVTEKAISATTSAYVIDAKYPQFGIPTIDASIAKIVTDSITQFKSDASTTDPEDSNPENPYQFQSQYDAAYAAHDIVSAELIISQYTGGAHPGAYAYGLNYDPTTGTALTLNDALKMIGLTLPQVSAQATEQINAQFGADELFADGLKPTSDNYGTFVIDANKVTFIFQEYQVAPYAAGMPEVSFARKK